MQVAAQVLLCVFPYDTVTYIPVLVSYGSYPRLSGPPFSKGDNKGETFNYPVVSTHQSPS